MKQLTIFVSLLIIIVFMTSFIDFMDYWTVKINGKIVFDSSKDSKAGSNTAFHYTVILNKLSPLDTIEVEYITDTRCFDCVCTYFISEHNENNGITSNNLQTYLKEQKSLGEKPYKISLSDIYYAGTKGINKAVYYYTVNGPGPKELCYINFK